MPQSFYERAAGGVAAKTPATPNAPATFFERVTTAEKKKKQAEEAYQSEFSDSIGQLKQKLETMQGPVDFSKPFNVTGKTGKVTQVTFQPPKAPPATQTSVPVKTDPAVYPADSQPQKSGWKDKAKDIFWKGGDIANNVLNNLTRAAGLGAALDLPQAIKEAGQDPSFNEVSNTDILKASPGATKQVASGVGSFTLGAVVNPALGIQEEITGNKAGKVHVLGMDFESPQSQVKSKIENEHWDPALAPWSVLVDQLNASSAFVGTVGAVGNKFQGGLNKIFKYEQTPVMLKSGSGTVAYTDAEGNIKTNAPGGVKGETVKPRGNDLSTHLAEGETLLQDQTKFGVTQDGQLVTVTPTDKGGFMMSKVARRFIGTPAKVPVPGEAAIEPTRTTPVNEAGTPASEAPALNASKNGITEVPATSVTPQEATGAAKAAETALSTALPQITNVASRTASVALKELATQAQTLIQNRDTAGLTHLTTQLEATIKTLPKSITPELQADITELQDGIAQAAPAVEKLVANDTKQQVAAAQPEQIKAGPEIPQVQQPPIEQLTAPSVLSVVANGEKIYTKLTPQELDYLSRETSVIPKAAQGYAQIHLDATNGKSITRFGREVNRQEFAAAHPQAADVLTRAQAFNVDTLPPEANDIIQQIQQIESTVRDEAGIQAAEPQLQQLQAELARVVYKHSTRPLAAHPSTVNGETLSERRALLNELNQEYKAGADNSHFDNMAAAEEASSPIGAGGLDRAEVIRQFVREKFDAAGTVELQNFDTVMQEQYGLTTAYEKADMASEFQIALQEEVDRMVKEEIKTNMREEVLGGEAGQRASNDQGEWYAIPSTFPEWFKNRGWTKSRILNTIDRYRGTALDDLKDIAESNLANGANYTFAYSAEPDVQYSKLKETINKLEVYGRQQRELATARAEAADLSQANAESKGRGAAANGKSNVRGYAGPKQLTTNILEDLKGKEKVSKQFIQDLTRKPEIRKVERDLVNRVLDMFPDGERVSAEEFGKAVELELLPLTRVTSTEDFTTGVKNRLPNTDYSAITVLDDAKKLRYQEHIYESPIQTKAGNIHWKRSVRSTNDEAGNFIITRPGTPEHYFAHARTEDLADGGVRRVSEIQSDLFQRGRIEQERIKQTATPIEGTNNELVSTGKFGNTEVKPAGTTKQLIENRDAEVDRLKAFEDLWQERIVNEEIRAAANESIKRLRFPTGETAMKIEGLTQSTQFTTQENWDKYQESLDPADTGNVKPEDIKPGAQIVRSTEGDAQVIYVTEDLGNGKFKAVTESALRSIAGETVAEKLKNPSIVNYEESYDINAKVDAENPIYKFYESELHKYLERIRPDLKTITDEYGNTWFETKITPKDKVQAVQAFGASRRVTDPLLEAQNTEPAKFTKTQKQILIENAKQGRSTYPFGGVYTTSDGGAFIATGATEETVQGFRIQGVDGKLEKNTLATSKLEPATMKRSELKPTKLVTAAVKKVMAENVTAPEVKIEQITEEWGDQVEKMIDSLRAFKLAGDDENIKNAYRQLTKAITESPAVAKEIAAISRDQLQKDGIKKIYRYGDLQGSSWAVKPDEYFARGDRPLQELELTPEVLDRVIYYDNAVPRFSEIPGTMNPFPKMPNQETEVLLRRADQPIETPADSLRAASQALAEVTNERIGEVPAPSIGLQVEDRAKFKRPAVDDTIKRPGASSMEGEIRFSDENVEARYQASKGLKGDQTSRAARLKEYIAETFRSFTREYKHMPKTAEFAPLRELLRHHQSAKEIMADKAVRMLQAVVGDLGPKKMDLLTRKIMLDDFSREAAAGRKLPFGFTPEAVEVDIETVNRYIQANPDVATALGRRATMMQALQQDLVKYKVLTKDQVKEDYFRHQVISYAQDPLRVKGTGERLRVVKRGYQKQRHGSELDINSDYLQAEFEVMAQGMVDIETAKVIESVKQSPHNIKPVIQDTLKQVNAALDGTVNFDQDKGPLATEDELIKAARMIEEKFTVGDNSTRLGKATNEIARKIGDQIRAGHPPVDWHDFIPAGYSTWQPKEGNVFYRANSIPERLAKQLMSDAVESLEITKEELRNVTVLGGPNEEFALVDEVAATLNELVKFRDEFALKKFTRELTSMWKVWVLFNPRRAIRYNLQNFVGDMDALIAGNPRVLTKVKRAVSELYDVYYGNKAMSPDMQDFFDRGGLESNITAQEIPDISTLKIFKSQVESQKSSIAKKGFGVISGYWNAVKNFSNFREQIFRYAAYLKYLEQVQAAGTRPLKNYGASIPAEINALTDPKDKAAKLSRELLGDYAALSATGKELRQTLIPFYSWMEVNFVRYQRLFKNAFYTGGSGGERKSGWSGAAGGARIVASTGVKFSFNLTAFLVRVAAVWGAMQLYNQMFHGEDEALLSDYDRRRLHINLGKDKNGEVRIMRLQSSLADFVEWFGLNQFPTELQQLNDGQLDMETIIKNRLKAPVNKVLQGVTPAIKTPVEFLSKRSFFPDVFNPRVVRDPWQNLAGAFSLDTEYRMLNGKPIRGYGDSWKDTIFTSYDPDSIAYDQIQSLKRQFMEKELGREGDSSYSTPRSEAFRDYKTALKYGDSKTAAAQLKKLGDLGVSPKDLDKSLDAADPLYGLSKGATDPSKNDRKKFLLWLNAEQRQRLGGAYRYYLETIRGVPLKPGDNIKLDLNGGQNQGENTNE